MQVTMIAITNRAASSRRAGKAPDSNALGPSRGVSEPVLVRRANSVLA